MKNLIPKEALKNFKIYNIFSNQFVTSIHYCCLFIYLNNKNECLNSCFLYLTINCISLFYRISHIVQCSAKLILFSFLEDSKYTNILKTIGISPVKTFVYSYLIHHFLNLFDHRIIFSCNSLLSPLIAYVLWNIVWETLLNSQALL